MGGASPTMVHRVGMRIIAQWLPSMWGSYGRAEYSSFRTVDSGAERGDSGFGKPCRRSGRPGTGGGHPRVGAWGRGADRRMCSSVWRTACNNCGWRCTNATGSSSPGPSGSRRPANPTTSLPRRGQQAKGFRALDPPTSTQARRLEVGDAPYLMGPHVLDTLLVKKELSRARQHPTSRSRPRPF